MLVKEALVFRRAGAIGLRIAPAIEQIASLSVMAAAMTGRFSRRCAVVDDPDFAEFAAAHHHLIELGVVSHGIAVGPIGQKTGKLPPASGADIADAFQTVQRVVFFAVGLLSVDFFAVRFFGVIFFRIVLIRRGTGKSCQIAKCRSPVRAKFTSINS